MTAGRSGDFDPRLRLELRGAQISSDGGLLVTRELDDALRGCPIWRQVVGDLAVDARAASASQTGRFETETHALPANRTALANLYGQWIDRFSIQEPDRAEKG